MMLVSNSSGPTTGMSPSSGILIGFISGAGWLSDSACGCMNAS